MPTRVRALPANATVRWREGMRPVAYPHPALTGKVFFSVGRETRVVWDGETFPVLVFTGALEVVK